MFNKEDKGCIAGKIDHSGTSPLKKLQYYNSSTCSNKSMYYNKFKQSELVPDRVVYLILQNHKHNLGFPLLAINRVDYEQS